MCPHVKTVSALNSHLSFMHLSFICFVRLLFLLLICYHFYVPILFIRSVMMFIVSVCYHIICTSSVFDIIETEGALLEVTVRFIRSVLPSVQTGSHQLVFHQQCRLLNGVFNVKYTTLMQKIYL